MKTYQDLQKVVGNEDQLKMFIMAAISDYKGSEAYKLATDGDAYFKQQNTTIMTYRKLLYTISGQAVPDNFSANHKIASNFYKRFNVQENQYLLGNGVNFEEDSTKEALGTKRKAFDTQVQKLGKIALNQGVAFGFYNMDHIDPFTPLEFAPLYDEDDGALKSGIRFWQINPEKPLRVTLYELDGYTHYIKRKTDKTLEVLQPKRAYKIKYNYTDADGIEIFNGENYPEFPIVPLWSNSEHICNIKSWKYGIDCYDLIKSGFANDVDDASLIYWTINNAGGMDEVDLAQFIQRMKTVHAATIDSDGASAEAHTMDVPTAGREACLTRIEKDLIKDAMALDTEAMAQGSITATAIKAAYEPLNNKTDDFEYCVIEFIQGILELAGIDDNPTFKRSTIVNQTEETNMVLSAAEYLDDETILKHLPFISIDEIDDILDKLEEEEASLYEDEETGIEDEEMFGEEEEVLPEDEEADDGGMSDLMAKLEEILGGL